MNTIYSGIFIINLAKQCKHDYVHLIKNKHVQTPMQTSYHIYSINAATPIATANTE